MTDKKDKPERGELIDFPQREANVNAAYIVYPVSMDGFVESRQVSDSSKRSVTLTFKLRPDEARQLEELVVEYRDEGYRTVSDILRHAIRDHISRLLITKRLKKQGALDNTWAVLQQMLEEARVDLHSAKWNDSIAKTEEFIAQCQGVNARGEIQNKLAKLRRNIGSMHNEFWRNFWGKEITRRWGQYEQ